MLLSNGWTEMLLQSGHSFPTLFLKQRYRQERAAPLAGVHLLDISRRI